MLTFRRTADIRFDSQFSWVLDLDLYITTINQSEITDIILTKNSDTTKSILDKIRFGKDTLSHVLEVQQGIIHILMILLMGLSDRFIMINLNTKSLI